MNIRNRLFTVFSLIGLLIMPHHLLAAEEVYIWEEEGGRINMSDRPPLGKNIRVQKMKSSQHSATNTADMIKEAVEENDRIAKEQAAAAKQQQIEKSNQAAKKQNCENARTQLRVLEQYARVRETDADGNVRFLGDEEKMQRTEAARVNVETFCTP